MISRLVANLVTEMLNLPVYLRGSTYYLHTRVYGRQVKRSLGTSDKKTAMILAGQLLAALVPMTLKKYEIDLGRGVFKSEGAEDHTRMLDALETIGKLNPTAPSPPGSPSKGRSGLRMPDVVEKFFRLKTQLKPGTVLSYKKTVNEFAGFINNPLIEDVNISDVTRYQEDLTRYNNIRTIDGKMAALTSVFNFAIKQGYYFKENPAAGRKLMTKQQKAKTGYAIFEIEEIQKLFDLPTLQAWKKKDPDYYYVCLICLVSGCRISEVTGILKSQLKQNPVPHINILDSKTTAGIRKVPLPKDFFEEILEFAKYKSEKQQVFKYQFRLGKGSGNAVGQKFARHLDKIGMTERKLVFHSLRKFFNNYSMKQGKIPIEPRCQMIGHELDNVNVAVYSNEFEIEDLANIFSKVQGEILNLTGWRVKVTPEQITKNQ